jgi:hypothetical protein
VHNRTLQKVAGGIMVWRGVPKGPCVKGMVPEWCGCEVVEPVLCKGSRSLGHVLSLPLPLFCFLVML